MFKTFGKLDGEESVKLNEQGSLTFSHTFSHKHSFNFNIDLGVGLGLVISNMIAFSLSEEKEGLTVNSEYNKGTNFQFKILNWNVKQSEIAEAEWNKKLRDDEEEVKMRVIAEEDEGQG